MDQLSQWLEDNLPEDDGRVCLVHGDFRLDNMMFAKDKPQVIALLDWELSTLGHPFADLAYQCMQLRMPAGMGSIDGLKDIDRGSLGIPTEQEYVDLYCQRMGIELIENWVFYLAFSLKWGRSLSHWHKWHCRLSPKKNSSVLSTTFTVIKRR